MQESDVCPPDPVTEWYNLREIATKPSQHTAENIARRAEDDNSQEQQKRKNYVELAKTLDTHINTGQHRCQRDARNDDN